MVDLHDYDIELIEEEILWKFNDNRHDYSDCGCLLSLRKDMINKRFFGSPRRNSAGYYSL